jgi:aspartate/methionine/tyrosine aminotransferase
VPLIRREEELVLDLLEQEGILVHPGYFFDFPREAVVVISLLTTPEDFRDASMRLLQFAAS